jgi:paraquat-inducible protein B
MARKANPAVIGAFVLGAVVLAVGALVVFGGGKLFRQTRPVVAYFDGSLKGMALGAPVTFNGVKIGAVTDFRVIVDPETTTVTTPVYFEVDASRLYEASGKNITLRTDSQTLKVLFQKGLRAQLEISSLVTGQLEVALNFHPGAPLRLRGLSKDVPEVPTIPSSIERLTKTLEKVPLEEIVADVRQTLSALNKIANSPEIKAILTDVSRTVVNADRLVVAINAEIPTLAANLARTGESARTTLAELQATVNKVGVAAETALTQYQTLAANADAQIGPLVANINTVAASADRALVQAQRALTSADAAINEDSPLRYDLAKALREVQAAARSLRILTDYLDQHPESVISGKRAEGTR